MEKNGLLWFLTFEVLGVYSYKDKFEGKEYQEKLYEISDLSAAGLTKRSFIDVSLSYEVTFNDLFYAIAENTRDFSRVDESASVVA
ncbi:hypothetical protein I6N95_25975 [Vagococcus sp. BWB3-3]|uniref:Uncharacterized protein n=1 Tax=Vagococcus allomyrinae TaxID=2794353 RepID=A0A940PEB0_9ENTE|nr:hypothetical protein [Vagococcus allomyrinae]MBP1044461.1 hypothetical protein [Vagococcus allomyrinae]